MGAVVLAATTSPCHGAFVVMGCPPRSEPRCAACGHRIALDGPPPVRSRSLPLGTWAGELSGRRQARQAGRRARRGH